MEISFCGDVGVLLQWVTVLARIRQLPVFFPQFLLVHFLLYSAIWTIFAPHFDFIPVQKTGAG